ncbi:rhodanese-related sulfurtransferase [Crocosphaera sp. XPORK-15E]|uniref:oxygen-dependent tRNA uridine(34) hydroxylase TrhO n=1 Tax=Crocosphaera sp. XPORK-15E TaxID=3110247 RepID=UPI002B21D540|nr:rhodanese-related sulfurtransferase [Crocosphaera sp. XPORK-15E]MEA5534991.1 rhodanese-related sulfurtransferase [Crocosphaera sp. XPORK-15E]
MSYTVATFYKFVSLPDFAQKQASLLAYCQNHQIKGTILLSQEGINGTIAGTSDDIEAVINYLCNDLRFADLEVKYSSAQQLPFERIKVRLKQEIVTLGMPEIDPSQQVGIYVNAKEWNQLISDNETIVIDTRNIYEVDIGSFQGAINPQTHSFREFPDYVRQNLDPKKHKKIAMFCTGGIRCEKATSFLLKEGFTEVYHLKGGILKYLEEVPPAESLWEGECFVFDERVAIKHQLEGGSYEMCLGCGYPISEEDKLSSEYEEGVSCPHCFASLNPEKLAKQREKQRQLHQKI